MASKFIDTSFDRAVELFECYCEIEGHVFDRPSKFDSVHVSRNVWRLVNISGLLAIVNCRTAVVNGIRVEAQNGRPQIDPSNPAI